MSQSGTHGPHPDLRQLVADAVNDLDKHLPTEQRLSAPVSADQITIRCQRTWHNITTHNPHLNGADFSACVAQFEQDDALYSFFIEAVRSPNTSSWAPAGLSGGKHPRERRDRAGGFMLAGGSHVCVGGIGAVPDGGSIRVEMADGTVYESQAVDGCCIVFAPVATPPGPDDHVTVRYLNPDRSERGADTVWMGDGKPPPGVRPRPSGQ